MEKDAPPCLNLLTKKAPYKGLSADSEEKHEPVSDIDTAAVDSLKALDPKRPIREADMSCWQSQNGSYGISARPDHSGLMLAARITLPHFSVSFAMSLPKSDGDPASGVPPKSRRRALILGSASPALICPLSLLMISAGVLAATPKPAQKLASKPGKKSPIGGMSGKASARAAVVTASARSLPTCK